MQVQSVQEALFLACEMERGAARLYERALMLPRDPERENETLRAGLLRMRGDEERHLTQFQNLYQGLEEPEERRLTLSAVADGLLFEGGLMGAVRGGLLKDVPSMLRLASDAEKKAAETYRAFAANCRDAEARAMLLGIAGEESSHLAELLSWLDDITA